MHHEIRRQATIAIFAVFLQSSGTAGPKIGAIADLQTSQSGASNLTLVRRCTHSNPRVHNQHSQTTKTTAQTSARRLNCVCLSPTAPRFCKETQRGAKRTIEIDR